MSLKTILARLATFLTGGHVGETLTALSASAQADYDAALNRAHAVLADAKQELGKVAVVELERLETLIDAAKRRAQALEDSGVLPTGDHSARLAVVSSKVA